MPREDVAWLAFWAGFALLDLSADRRGKSLCTSVRRLGHFDTAPGRAVSTAAFGCGVVVLYRHLFR